MYLRASGHSASWMAKGAPASSFEGTGFVVCGMDGEPKPTQIISCEF